jgi:exopolyphosphatase / guanosine-5'-triphosphate,3'-diphosphate pyrophosphatase
MPGDASPRGAVRVAAVDMGTNSTRLLVADVADGRVDEVVNELRVTRLGQGVDRTRQLDDEAVARTLAVLREYRALIDEAGAPPVLATATSAVRDATNGAAFLARVHDELGFETRLLSGLDEGRTTFRGVMTGNAAPSGRLAIVDVGGGSTEVSVGDAGGLERSVSLDAGCVRATERWLAEGAVATGQLAAARTALDALFAQEVDDAFLPVSSGIAVAGTATTLAALDLGLARYDRERTHGHLLGRAAIERWLERLAPLSIEERLALGPIEPGRAPVLVGGTLVLAAALDRLGLDVVTVSERDILHGIALAAADG